MVVGGAARNKPRGGDTSDLTPPMLATVRADVGQGPRTWKVAQICDWVAPQHGVRISPGRMRVHLKRANLTYRRTARSLRRKQQPEDVAERKAVLTELERKRRPG